MSLSLLLRCVDLRETKDFYESVLGFSSEATSQGTLTVQKGDARLIFTAQDLWHHAPRLSGTVYIAVADVDAYFEDLRDRAPVAWPLQNMPYGSREFAITDCNGYLIAFQQQGPAGS